MANGSTRILLVDDEQSIQTLLSYPLRKDGYHVTSAQDGREALQRFEEARFDLVILDLMLPKLDGVEVCRELRARSQVPIIMLTAKGSETDKVAGLEVGADDYITKPFSMREFRSRVKAALRRSRMAGEPPGEEAIDHGELKIDFGRRMVTLREEEVRVTYVEFEILGALARSPGRVLSRETLLEHVWGDSEYRDPRTVDVHIRHLREKLETDPKDPEFLFTVRGVGYRFRERTVRRFRLTSVGSRIIVISVAIAVGTTLMIYGYTVAIGGGASGAGEVKAQIFIGGALAVILAAASSYYYAHLVSRNIRRLQEAARKVADGNFEMPIPISSVGQFGQLARTFNEMQRRLAELDSARKQFIANASHELRTPIFSLGGFVELLEEEDPSPEERAEFVHTMREQIVRLTKLTADLLDLSQLDAGAVAMRANNVDLAAVAREVAREFGPRADRRGSRLELRTPEEAVIASADPDRVRQVIRILLDNALTHTPEGTKVTVTTYAVNRRAELTVSDDGPGIPRRVQGRIFERFYTADSAGGSGLGLAIARELAQRMQGRVAVASSKRFTAFTLDLPRSRTEVVATPSPATSKAAA